MKVIKALFCLCIGIALLLHLSACRQQPKETWIGVYAERCVTVTNAEGETLTIDRTEASGSMKILEQKYQMMLYSPSICYYKVPYSRSFCFTSDDSEVYCYVGWDDLYRDYTGSGAATVNITEQSIAAIGASLDYTLCASAGIGSYRYYEVTGSEESSITLTLGSDLASASGQSDYDFRLVNLRSSEVLRSAHAKNGAYTELTDIKDSEHPTVSTVTAEVTFPYSPQLPRS